MLRHRLVVGIKKDEEAREAKKEKKQIKGREIREKEREERLVTDWLRKRDVVYGNFCLSRISLCVFVFRLFYFYWLVCFCYRGFPDSDILRCRIFAVLTKIHEVNCVCL